MLQSYFYYNLFKQKSLGLILNYKYSTLNVIIQFETTIKCKYLITRNFVAVKSN